MKKNLIVIMCIITLISKGSNFENKKSISKEKIKEITYFISNEIGIRVTGTDKEKETANFLVKELEKIGYNSKEKNLFIQKFKTIFGEDSQNIIAIHNSNENSPLVSIVCHYDSVATSIGAGDNAVANGILLEIANYLHKNEDKYKVEVRMVFLGAEENGYHGSRYYVDSLSKRDKKRHIAGYNMDISAAQVDDKSYLVANTLGGKTTGGYKEGNYFEPIENKVSISISRAYKKLYGERFGGTYHMGESDQVSFNEEELDAANICWRQLEEGYPVLPEEYHKEIDTPEKLDYTTAVITGETILEGIKILLNEEKID